MDDFEHQIDKMKTTNISLAKKIDTMRETNRLEHQSRLEDNEHERHLKEADFHGRILAEYERYEQLQNQTEREKLKFDDQVKAKEQLHADSINESAQDFESRLQMKSNDLTRVCFVRIPNCPYDNESQLKFNTLRP